MNNLVRIITFSEFEDMVDVANLTYPNDRMNIGKNTLGVILNNTFCPVDFSTQAEIGLKFKLSFRIDINS